MKRVRRLTQTPARSWRPELENHSFSKHLLSHRREYDLEQGLRLCPAGLAQASVRASDPPCRVTPRARVAGNPERDILKFKGSDGSPVCC